MPLVSVILGTFNRLAFLKLTIASVRVELIDVAHEIIVIDGGSTDGTIRWLARQKDILTIVQHNRGIWRGSPISRRSWGYFMNLGFRCSQGKFVCMLSDDCLVVSGAIRRGCWHFESLLAEGQKVGAVPFYFRDVPEEPRFHVMTVGGVPVVNHGMYLNAALKTVGYANESDYTFYYADFDLVLRLVLEHGFTSVPSPTSLVEHYSHANAAVRKSNRAVQKKDRDAFWAKWRTPLEQLQASSPHLTEASPHIGRIIAPGPIAPNPREFRAFLARDKVGLTWRKHIGSAKQVMKWLLRYGRKTRNAVDR